MKNLKVFVLLIIFIVFLPWFNIYQNLSSGDWPYLFLENIKDFLWIPERRFLWLAFYYQIPAKILVEYLGLSWDFVEKIVWFWPFILLSIISSYYLSRSWLGVLIYTTNTYILMLVGGGQMGIALAYSIAPLVLRFFIKLFNSPDINYKQKFIAGLILAVQVMFDPRVSYITLLALLVYVLITIWLDGLVVFKKLLSAFLIISGIVLVWNSFWILPMLLGKGQNPALLAGTFVGTSTVEFFSFAKFENTISLLHPNWPENVFGKVGFQIPKFLSLPIIAFSSLLFINGKRKMAKEKAQVKSPNKPLAIQPYKRILILFSALIGLLGVFLAKGSNPPLARVYLWAFEYIPGFVMFRDPTKFYILIALSYSVLIPFTINIISKLLASKIPSIKYAISVVFILFWLFTIREAVVNRLGGTFKPRQVPQEYAELKDFIYNQDDFFRTFWIPQKQRFGFFSNNHPAIGSTDLLKVTSSFAVVNWLQNDDSQKKLTRLKVKYIIIPYDSEGELFLENRKYSKRVRDKVLEDIERIDWLRRVEEFEKNAVFKIAR